jgi:quercetin dioxygenase-like cupin family protein
VNSGGKLDFGAVDWEDDQADIRSRAAAALGSRWAVIEYKPHALRGEWCVDGHRGYVLAGRIEYEFDNGADTLVVEEGQAFFLAAGTGHRGRNPGGTVTRLFLIDDAS